MGVERDRGAFHVGDLAQGEARRPFLAVLRQGFDGHRVADGERVPGPLGRRSHPLVFAPGPRPRHLGEGNLSARSVGEADLRPVFGEAEDDGKTPRRETGRRRNFGERRRPVPVGVDGGDRPAPAVAPVVGGKAVAQGGVDDGLKAGIESRAHRKAAVVKGVPAVA